MISVIVPVYNVVDYLPRCLDSIVGQTYRDLEIILVDDGSTDSSGKICDEYAMKDSRITVIHQKNKGLAEARNSGLINARGEYISFIDSDDYIDPEMLEVLYDLIQRKSASLSMVMFRYVYDTTAEQHAHVDYDEIPSVVFDRDEMMQGMFHFLADYQESLFHVVWNKLYRRDLICGLRFNESGTEDMEFNNRVFLRAERMVMGRVCLYNYLQRLDSIIHHGINERQVSRIDAHYRMFQTYSANQKLYKAYCLDKLYKVIFQIRFKARGSSLYAMVNEKSKYFMKLTWKDYWRNGALPAYRKLGILTLFYCPFLYSIFISLAELRAKILRK